MEPLSQEEQLFLAADEMRRRKIEQEDAAASAGLEILSRHPAWASSLAEVSSTRAELKKAPFPLGIDESRNRAFDLLIRKSSCFVA
jgi:hypothetical protein